MAAKSVSMCLFRPILAFPMGRDCHGTRDQGVIRPDFRSRDSLLPLGGLRWGKNVASPVTSPIAPIKDVGDR